MPKPRNTLVSLDATPYYHLVSRCVRRAYLCGKDETTGRDYEHRRVWIEERLLYLGQLFALDIGAYAVMSNHFHVVVHVNQAQTDSWSDTEVIERWHALFSGIALSKRYLAGEPLTKAEEQALSDTVTTWRLRLADLSWFMRCLNEPIARQANAEDQCTGRFWEGRFRSQALLDEAALAACLAYVDLNPVRACMADTPESSDHTSVQRRVRAVLNKEAQPEELLPFVGYPRHDQPEGLPFRLTDYLELVDWSGRILRDDKRGAIPEKCPPILERLNIEPKHWLYMTSHFESRFQHLVGAAQRLKQACRQLGYQRTPGLRAATELLN